MQSEEIKMRFGRCPYCRAMIYQNPKAVIYYCSKCRTPIRGKNPEPTDDTDSALAQLEILSADTVSVFSDEFDASNPQTSASVIGNDGDQPPLLSSLPSYANFNPGTQEIGASSLPYRAFNSARTCPRSSSQNENEQITEPRPSSRRTRRLSTGYSNISGDDMSSSSSDVDTPTSAADWHRRSSPLSSKEKTCRDLSRPVPTRSPLADPAFHKGMLQALDNLRKFIAAVEHPYSSDDHLHDGARRPLPMSAPSCNNRKVTLTRRDSRLIRRLESQIERALPTEGPRQHGSASSLSSASSRSSSSSHSEQPQARKRHCSPVLGGAPLVFCDKCSELLQLPVNVLSRDKVTRLQCGGCEEVLTLMLPASGSADRPKRIFSAPQPDGHGIDDTEYMFARGGLSGEQERPELPLHRAMGYSSVSSVLQSRRYGQYK